MSLRSPHSISAKHTTLHPLSVIVGVALSGIFAISTGMEHPIRAAHEQPRAAVPASWWTHVEFDRLDASAKKTQAFTVPADRYFVVTAASSNSKGGGLDVLLNGSASQSLAIFNAGYQANGTRVAIPPGTVLSTNAGYASLWGYLEPTE